MIVAPGATSISVDVQFLDDSGFALTGKVAADFPACKWSGGSNTADTTIALSDLAAITTAHPNDNTAGGVKEREGGWYRLDLPNNMLTSAGRKTLTFAETTNKRIIAPFVDCQYAQTDVRQLLGTAWLAPGIAGTPDVNVKLINAVATSSVTTIKAIQGYATDGAIPAAVAGAAGGLFIAGTNAATTITSSSGDALTLSSTGSNGSGLNASGNGTADGIKATGGATGRGIHAIGGATSGAGIRCEAQGGNSLGIHGLGFGSGPGMQFEGGATGPGAKFMGGATSGNGIDVVTVSGHGINLAPVGASMHGMLVTGGNAGTSDGLKLVAGTGGVGFRLDTLTASGAVTLSSTLTVSGATSLQALSMTTLTASGAVAFQSTFTVTGTTSLATVTVSNNLTVTGSTTFTGAVTATNAGNDIRGVTVSSPTVAQIATAIWQDATAGDFTTAGSIGKSLFTSGVVPGAAGGLFIAGSNAATTIAGLTTGALSCTTITASGAVAFQSTFAVTGTTTLTGAVTASNASNNIVVTSVTNAITLPSIPANWITSAGVDPSAAAPTTAQITTAVLTTQMTEDYAADGVAPTLAQCLFLTQQSLHEFSIVGTTRTVKKLDGSTAAATFTLNSSTAPTATTRAA